MRDGLDRCGQSVAELLISVTVAQIYDAEEPAGRTPNPEPRPAMSV
jgi:hypothetical protein